MHKHDISVHQIMIIKYLLNLLECTVNILIQITSLLNIFIKRTNILHPRPILGPPHVQHLLLLNNIPIRNPQPPFIENPSPCPAQSRKPATRLIIRSKILGRKRGKRRFQRETEGCARGHKRSTEPLSKAGFIVHKVGKGR